MERVPSKHIALILLKQEYSDRYMKIINRALLNGYHDFKFENVPGHPEFGDCICPKMQLVEDLGAFPELAQLQQDVIAGVYDDPPDEVDDITTRNMLLNDRADDFLFKMLGFEIPSLAEREAHFEKSRQN